MGRKSCLKKDAVVIEKRRVTFCDEKNEIKNVENFKVYTLLNQQSEMMHEIARSQIPKRPYEVYDENRSCISKKKAVSDWCREYINPENRLLFDLKVKLQKNEFPIETRLLFDSKLKRKRRRVEFSIESCDVLQDPFRQTYNKLGKKIDSLRQFICRQFKLQN